MNTTTLDAETAVEKFFSLESPESLADPFPVYSLMLDHLPIYRWGPVLALSRYEDVKTAFRHANELSSVRVTGTRAAAVRAKFSPEQQRKLDVILDNEARWLVQIDDPEHKRLRRHVNPSFGKQRIEEMRGRIEALATELLDEAEKAHPGELELISEFAYRLPLMVMCELLGADPEDAARIRDWSNSIATAVGTDYANLDDAYEAVLGFQAYIRELIVKAQRDGAGSALFRDIVAGPEGEPLDEADVVSMFTLLFFAGHETTTNQIANAMVSLIENPDQRAILLEDPGLIKGAIDELLRYKGSVQVMHRTATQDFEISGVPISKGQSVRLLVGAANRDPSVFDDPDRLDVTRENARRHLGFGFGRHTCLGIWLAKLETEVAITELLRRYPEATIAGDVPWLANMTVQGPSALHLEY